MPRQRSLIRRAENTKLWVGSLESIAEIRGHLDRLEVEAVKSAIEKGVTVEDISEAMGITRQATYYRLRHNGQGPTKRGRRARPRRPRAAGLEARSPNP